MQLFVFVDKTTLLTHDRSTLRFSQLNEISIRYCVSTETELLKEKRKRPLAEIAIF